MTKIVFSERGGARGRKRATGANQPLGFVHPPRLTDGSPLSPERPLSNLSTPYADRLLRELVG